MVAGSVASSYHGEPRVTRDLDIVIDPDSASLGILLEGMECDGLYVDPDAAQAALGHPAQSLDGVLSP